MTKKAFLEAALKAGGLTKSIYTSLKQLKHAAGTQYGAVLRISDTPVRATSKKTFKDQQGASLIRRKLYTCETAYNDSSQTWKEASMMMAGIGWMSLQWRLTG